MTSTSLPVDVSTCPFECLEPWPHVLKRLKERGVALAQGPKEDRTALENRIGTRLMALYRDSRDPACFEALYVLARPAVLRWIRSLLSRELAHLDPAELLQDTFLNVYRYPSAFREDHPASFRVWVRTIAGNVMRRACSRRPHQSTLEFSTELNEPEDHGAGPSLAAEHGEESHRLRAAWMLFLFLYEKAFQTLAQRDRRTLQLVEVEGLSYRDAGALLGVGRSNMKMIVFRSRKRIASRMRLAMNVSVVRPREGLGAA